MHAVGGALRRAAAYHSTDFAFEEVVPAGRAFEAAADAAAAAAPVIAPPDATPEAWARFHYRHAGRFFHSRGYLHLAFPALGAALAAPGPPLRVLEVGCGNGSNVWPLLEGASPRDVHVVATDFVPSAVRTLALRQLPAAASARRGGDGATTIAAAAATATAPARTLTLALWDVVSGAAPSHVAEWLARTASDAGAASVAAGADVVAAAAAHSVGSGSDDSDEESAGGIGSTAPPSPRLSEWVREWQTAGEREVVAASFDFVICCFVLSALPPHLHAAGLANLRRLVKPGGHLLVRDYGVYDAAMLRAKADAVVTPRLHRRGDGTLAYYFELGQMREMLAGAGLHAGDGDAHYCRVLTRNRGRGVEMRRVWVNATAQRPREGDGAEAAGLACHDDAAAGAGAAR